MDQRRGLLVALLFQLFIFGSIISGTTYAADTGFLSGNVQSNGSIASPSGVSLPEQSTAESLITLITLGDINGTYFNNVLNYINDPSLENSTENLSYRIAIKSRLGTPFPTELADLLSRSNEDGGFGAFAGYESTVIDTAFAIWALSTASSITTPEASDALAYLVNRQASSGGWGVHANDPPSIEITSLILQAMRLSSVRYSSLGNSIQKATVYLYSLQSPSGGWGGNSLTAEALLGVIPVTNDSTKYSASLNALISGQRTNKSWNDDVFVTAKALRAIKLSEKQSIPDVPNSAAVSGSIVDASGAPLSGVTISASGAATVQTQSDATGEFNLAISKVGSYTLTYSKSGYLPRLQQLSLPQLINLGAGIITLTKDTLSSNSAVVSGLVRDAESGNLLEGATISISGAASASAQTDAQGGYTAAISSFGAISIAVNKPGYQTTTASGTVTKGQNILFSPTLYKLDQTQPTTIPVSALVVDSVTGLPLPNVKLVVEQNGTTQQVTSGVSGILSLDNINAGAFKITISAPLYSTYEATGVVSVGSRVELGTLALKLLPTTSTLGGRVTNSIDGKMIYGAKIQIANTSLSATSDLVGNYTINGITGLQFVVEVSAPGFQTVSLQYNLTQPQTIELNPELSVVVNTKGVGINQVAPGTPTYGAYAKASFAVDFYNNADESADLQMVMELRGDNGYFARFPATHEVYPGDSIPDSILSVPGQTSHLAVNFSWLTNAVPPGNYQVLIQAYDLNTLQLKAERSSQFVIADTKRLTSASAKVSPKYVNFKDEKTVVITAEITNASNTSVNTLLAYTLKNPSGVIVRQGMVNATLAATETNKTVELSRFDYVFDPSGDYSLELTTPSGVVPENITNTKISVAPGVRVEPSLEATPNVVTPEQDKRIQIKVKLTGRKEG